MEYQAIVGKESDDYLLDIDKLSGEEIERKYEEKESSYDGLETDIFKQIIDLSKTRDNLERQYVFLLNYKNLINVKNELFGKQDTCGSENINIDGRITVNNIQRCLQHCELKYIDFLRVLKERYIELEDNLIDKEKKKALMFDIISLEKQISILYNAGDKGDHKDLFSPKNYKLQKGALIKVQENGDIYFGITKSNKKKNTTVSYCNKNINSETNTQECKNVREIIYNKDKEKELVIPILEFIKYYKSIAHLSNPIIKKGFVNDDNYEEQDVETYRNIEKTQLDKTNFLINKNKERLSDYGIEKQKHILFEYLQENKENIKDNIMNFCKELSYISTEDINDFTDKTLDTIYKDIPMIYNSIPLQNYIHNYILRFIKHICDNTRIEFSSQGMDEYKTQKEKEEQLDKEIKDIRDTLEKERISEENEMSGLYDRDRDKDISRIEQDRTQVVTYGRKGLTNIGNTCFMNAAIQVFSNIKPFRQFLFSLDKTNILDKPRNVKDELDRANSVRMFHLVSNLKNILANIWSGRANTSVDSDVIIPFRQKLSGFNMGGQHDANEMFMQIYNDIHEFLQEPFSVPLRHNNLSSVIVLGNGKIASTVIGDEDNELKEEFIRRPEFNQIHRNAILN